MVDVGNVSSVQNNGVTGSDPKARKPKRKEGEARTPSSLTGFLPSRISLHVEGMTGFGEMVNPDEMDPRRSVVLNEVGAMRYGAGIRMEGNGQVLPSTHLTWALNLNYREIFDYRRSINTDYDFSVVNPYFITRGWVGYDGINLFGLDVTGDTNSVINDKYRTRGNPEIQDSIYGGLYAGVPLTISGGMIMPIIGVDVSRSMADYSMLGEGVHLLQERVFELGVNGRMDSGWAYQLTGGMGDRNEETYIYSASTLPENHFFDDIQDPVRTDITNVKLYLMTPQLGPWDARYSFSGHYRDYRQDETAQWGAGARVHFDSWDAGVGYEHNPVLFVGPNDILTVDAKFAWNPAAQLSPNSKFNTPITLNPMFTMAKTYDGETSYFFLIKFDGLFGSAGGGNPTGSGAPTIIRSEGGR